MKEDKVYLDDILGSIEKIERYITDLTPAKFAEDSEAQDAVMRRLEIIGEAVKHLPNEVKTKHSDIPWKKIAGMRDILIHEYAGVQTERVWRTAKDDLPPLKQVVLELTKQNKQN